MFRATRMLRNAAAAIAKEAAPPSYMHYAFCSKTGRTVAHKFESIRAFTTWHYTQHGWLMTDNYPLVRVAKDPSPSEEGGFEQYELCGDDIVVLHE